jgi:esterase/lipase
MAKAPGEDKCAMTLKMPVGLSVMEDGKPFFFEGGKTGCLLIHGFTGTTSSMRPMGEFLAAKGVTVLGPRLPGHGTDVNDMGKWAYTDWTAMVETALAELRDLCDTIFVSGLSMGGLLTSTSRKSTLTRSRVSCRYPPRSGGSRPARTAWRSSSWGS